MSFPVIDPTKDKADALWDQLQVLQSITKGASPGYVTKQWRKKDLETLKQLYKAAGEAADEAREEKGPCPTTKVEKASYCLANYRDVRYALFGRIAMRTAGVNDQLLALYRRAFTMEQIEDLENKS